MNTTGTWCQWLLNLYGEDVQSSVNLQKIILLVINVHLHQATYLPLYYLRKIYIQNHPSVLIKFAIHREVFTAGTLEA